MNHKQYAKWGYEQRRRHRNDRAPLGPDPVLPTEMTAEGVAMEVELEHRRVTARKEALRKSRLKPYKLFAIRLKGGEVKP